MVEDTQLREHLENPAVQHEPSDMSLHWVIAILGSAVVLGAILHTLVFVFLQKEQRTAGATRKTQYPLTMPGKAALPPKPRLEQIDRLEAMASGAGKNVERMRVLNSFGSAKEAGFVHIPIDQAIKLIAGKLPARNEEPDIRSNGLVGGGESNSGRVLRRQAPWHAR